MSRADDRVAAAATAAGLQIAVRRFREGTRTADDAARAVGCDVAQIVKSLVFEADGEPVIALISGADRLDPSRLASALGAKRVDRANGDTVRTATGYAIGGVPPIGHVRPVPILMDRRLLRHTVVWAAAGLPNAVFSVGPHDLLRASGARLADLAVDRPGD